MSFLIHVIQSDPMGMAIRLAWIVFLLALLLSFERPNT